MRDLIASIEDEYRRYKTLGEGAMNQLADSQLAHVAGSGNSIVTIVWHLAGNLKSRFTDFLTSLLTVKSRGGTATPSSLLARCHANSYRPSGRMAGRRCSRPSPTSAM